MDVLTIVVVTLSAGFLGGLLGVGGGILMVPAFLLLLKDRIPSVHMAVGTSMAIIVVNAMAGTIQHWMGGRINWLVVAYGAAFAVIGGSAGAYVSGLVPTAPLQRLFAILLIAVALNMFFSKPKEARPDPPAEVKAAIVTHGRDGQDGSGVSFRSIAVDEEKRNG